MDKSIEDHVHRQDVYHRKLNEVDAKTGTKMYFKKSKELRKQYMKILIKGVRPPILKHWIRTKMAQQSNEMDRQSEHMFWKFLKEGSQHCEDFYVKGSGTGNKRMRDGDS